MKAPRDILFLSLRTSWKSNSDNNSRMRKRLTSALLSGDLKTWKRTGTSCEIEIHFSIKTTIFLFKYTLLCSQIYGRHIVLFNKHNYKFSASFIKERQRSIWLKTAKLITILLLVPGLFLMVRSARGSYFKFSPVATWGFDIKKHLPSGDIPVVLMPSEFKNWKQAWILSSFCDHVTGWR